MLFGLHMPRSASKPPERITRCCTKVNCYLIAYILVGYVRCAAVDQSRAYRTQNFIQIPNVLSNVDRNNRAQTHKPHLLLAPKSGNLYHGSASIHQSRPSTGLRANGGESELENLKLSTLKEQCRALGLAVSGTKAELINRILRFQALSGEKDTSTAISGQKNAPPSIQFQAPKVRVISSTDTPLPSEDTQPSPDSVSAESPSGTFSARPNSGTEPGPETLAAAQGREPTGRGSQAPRGFGKVVQKKAPSNRPPADKGAPPARQGPRIPGASATDGAVGGSAGRLRSAAGETTREQPPQVMRPNAAPATRKC